MSYLVMSPSLLLFRSCDAIKITCYFPGACNPLTNIYQIILESLPSLGFGFGIYYSIPKISVRGQILHGKGDLLVMIGLYGSFYGVIPKVPYFSILVSSCIRKVKFPPIVFQLGRFDKRLLNSHQLDFIQINKLNQSFKRFFLI